MIQTKLDQTLTKLAGYVESVAGNDEGIITKAGMEIRANRSTPAVPVTPQALSATAGDRDGEIYLSWKPVSNARSYTIEASTDPATPTSWTHVGIATSSSKNNHQFESRYALLVPHSRHRRDGPERLERTRNQDGPVVTLRGASLTSSHIESEIWYGLALSGWPRRYEAGGVTVRVRAVAPHWFAH